MESYQKLLLENKAWAQEMITYNPRYFERTAVVQTPDFLWIGCSDSRVPANEITNTSPGQMFVHRNIANMVIKDDLNLLSVVQYGVEVLKIKHIIICGHHRCGGVMAALQGQKMGLIDNWLAHIKKVYVANKAEIDACSSEDERCNLTAELNVKQQVINLMQTDIVGKAWKHSRYPELHGWIYGLENGLIREIVTLTPDSMQNPMAPFDL